ncbi:Trypsin-like peptidase domain-containing protein [Desulfatibacillum alkenivorans DSM 16219]|uniref:Trypsin-like peptidase domain-containing protein n=2 Tax=Desulfatibacillum alkenivorans TaxID=259354 RepID=A0A1M6KL27_9BACT|nr:Trypsin-like peptidase domain-containing protein [Desulfatibacillum alkenivorans DSM 16219]
MYIFRRSGTALLSILGLVFMLAGSAQAQDNYRTSFFNQKWLDTVVSIELDKPDKDPMAAGTGFLVITENKHILLITAKHVVLNEEREIRSHMAYRFNIQGGDSTLISDAVMEERGLGKWFVSGPDDLACRFVVVKDTFEATAIPQSLFLNQEDVQAGASIMILGYPLGLRSFGNSKAIARSGIVARSDETGIIADAFVFPGNSGGPVLYTPPIKVGGPLTTPLLNEERLVGLVYGLIPYLEPAISEMTKRRRVIFEENSGLARVASADAILKLITREDVTQFEETIPDNLTLEGL